MNCPKCSAEFETVSFKDIEVDRCTGCKGLWFDMLEKDDLVKIRALNLSILAMNKLVRVIEICKRFNAQSVVGLCYPWSIKTSFISSMKPVWTALAPSSTLVNFATSRKGLFWNGLHRCWERCGPIYENASSP